MAVTEFMFWEWKQKLDKMFFLASNHKEVFPFLLYFVWRGYSSCFSSGKGTEGILIFIFENFISSLYGFEDLQLLNKLSWILWF